MNSLELLDQLLGANIATDQFSANISSDSFCQEGQCDCRGCSDSG